MAGMGEEYYAKGMVICHVIRFIINENEFQITFEGIRGKEARAELLKDLRDVLGRLLHAGTAEDFEMHWEFMQTEYGNHPAWIKYLEDEYIKHKDRWSWAWRLVS